MIDLRRLRHFSALVQHGNFHRAADALHLTQPALTRSIQALEAHVSAPLLTRHRTGVEPTELGRLLLRHAGALEGQVRDLDRELRLAKGLALGELRVGVGPWGGSVLVGPVVGGVNALHPGLQLKVVLAPWQELPERARAREVDVVLGELREIEQLPDFECAPLSPHEVCVVARAGHPFSDEEEARIKQPIVAQYEQQAHAYYSSAPLWDDGVIDPAQTRDVLALALSASLNAPIPDTRFGVFRM